MIDRNEILEKIIHTRPPNYHSEFPLILFWSQKSGCTTFLKWFYDQIGLLDEALEYNQWIHTYDNEVYKSSPAYYQGLRENLLQSKKDTIKLVRNPYKRAVSQFLILATTKTLSPWDKEWQKIREFFYQDKNSSRGITFKHFLYYLRETNNYDMHFAPQYIEGEELFVKDYIYLEKFQEQIRQIERKYSLKKTDLSSISNSPHHYSTAMTVEGDFANHEINENTLGWKFPSYNSFYDREAIDLVNQVFTKDFEVYGYGKL